MKRALCVGINTYPGADVTLNGCVNDARAWAELLVDHFGFEAADVTVLLEAEATKAAIMNGLDRLLAGAVAGDVAVFTHSSHGTYVVDASGDEERYDEALCPYDCADHVILDDELRAVFDGVADGVSVFALIDTCHSGTMTRAIDDAGAADDRRPRFLDPTRRGAPALERPFLARSRHTRAIDEEEMNEIVLTGCKAIEYAHDAKFPVGHHGAMSFHALEAIRASGYVLTYDELCAQVNAALDAAGFSQHPQLEGRAAAKRRQVFT